MNERFRTFTALNFHLYDSSNTSGYFQIPKLEPTDWIPEDLIGFNYVLNKPDYTKGVHFFLDDYQFERVWNSPERYIDKLEKFDCVLTPDFSLYTDMPFAMQIWNVYRSRSIGSYWQTLGMTVIPTVSWSTHDSYSFCFDGLPENGIVAISTVGVMKNKEAKQLFYDGLDEMIARIHPSGILIWGQKIDYDFPPNIGGRISKITALRKLERSAMGGRGTSSGRNSNGGVVNGRRNGVKVGMNLDWFGSGKEVVSKKQKQFDAFRFQGMDVERESKKYYKIGAISEDGNKLLVSVGEDHLMKTQYGYSFAVSENKVVYLKDWQVQNSYRGGNLVLFDKKYFKPKETKYSNSSLEGAKETTFKDLTKAAKAQKNHLWQIKTKRY